MQATRAVNTILFRLSRIFSPPPFEKPHRLIVQYFTVGRKRCYASLYIWGQSLRAYDTGDNKPLRGRRSSCPPPLRLQQLRHAGSPPTDPSGRNRRGDIHYSIEGPARDTVRILSHHCGLPLRAPNTNRRDEAFAHRDTACRIPHPAYWYSGHGEAARSDET